MTTADPSSRFGVLRAWLEYAWAALPTVTADGRWVVFLSDRGGLPQPWVVPREGGVPRCLYPAKENVGRVLAAPGGKNLLLTVDRGGDEHWQLFVREGDLSDDRRPVRPLTADPARIFELGAWRDSDRLVFSANLRDERFFDVYEMRASSAEAPRLLRKEDALVSIAAADERSVLLSRANSNLDTDLLLLEDARETLLTPHSTELTVWSCDLRGGEVWAGANPDREFAALVRYRLGAPLEVVREFDGDVELVKCEPKGSRVAYSVNRQGRSELHVLDTRSSEDRVVPVPAIGVVGSISWVPEGEGFVFGLSSATTGEQVWQWTLATGAVRPVTQSPVPMPGPAVEPTLHTFRAEDGLEIPYWESVATGSPVRGTLIVVHGGPESQARPDFANGIRSYLASRGWRVIQPNVRGSTGYGRTYVHLDDVRKRMDSVRDLRDLVRALAAEGKARPGAVGIFGGSYGGFMVLSAITTYPELWGAAVEYFGIANFETFLEQTGPWRRKVREDEYGSLERDRSFLREISPLHHVDRIVAPLLVAHGENDVRVPLAEAEQIVRALKQRGVPVEFLRYADEGHGFMRIENLVDSYGRSEEFLAKHLPAE